MNPPFPAKRRFVLYAVMPVFGASTLLLTSVFPTQLPWLFFVDIVPASLMMVTSLGARELTSNPVIPSILFVLFHVAFWVPAAYGIERLWKWRKGGSRMRLKSRKSVMLVVILVIVAVSIAYVQVGYALKTCWGCPELVITGYDEDAGGLVTESLLLVPALVEPWDEGRKNFISAYDDAADYVTDACPPGIIARYNVDDGLDHAPGMVFAEIHCMGSNYVNLNDGLIYSEFARISEPLCERSEFAGAWWAEGCRN